MNKSIGLFAIIFSLNSCESCKEKPHETETLCSNSTIYDNVDLRTDGYYYLPFNDEDGTREIFFFYKNGVMLYGGITTTTELENEEQRYMNGDYYNSIKANINYWGRFSVSGGWFAFEHWYPGSSQWMVYVRDGDVINDSTLHVIKSYRCDGSENHSKDEYYHFKQLPIKPDSINQFVQ